MQYADSYADLHDYQRERDNAEADARDATDIARLADLYADPEALALARADAADWTGRETVTADDLHAALLRRLDDEHADAARRQRERTAAACRAWDARCARAAA